MSTALIHSSDWPALIQSVVGFAVVVRIIAAAILTSLIAAAVLGSATVLSAAALVLAALSILNGTWVGRYHLRIRLRFWLCLGNTLLRARKFLLPS